MKKILIIDDEADFCLLLKNFLSKKKFEVAYVHTLAAGKKRMNDLLPEILILDNNLPDGKGWESAAAFLEKFPFLHIYLVTAYSHQSVNFYAKERVTILEKPLSFKEIENSLKAPVN